MPKIRRLNLLDEWTYRWRAHRQGHTNGFFAEGSIEPKRVCSVADKFVVQILGPQILLQHHSCCRAIRFSRITFCSNHSGLEPFEQPLFPGTANPLSNFLTPSRMLISSLVKSVSPHGTPTFLRQKDICF